MPRAGTTSRYQGCGDRRRADAPLLARSLTALLLAAALFAGCTGRVETPRVAPRADAAERVPVVMVPGISGSVLRDRSSGEIVWGRGPEVLGPKDGGYAIALPIPPAGEESEATRLEAVELIDTMSIFGGLVKKPVYGPVLRTLEDNGWTRGDLDAPSPDSDLYAFAYDWRQDNLKTVAELLERLRALAAAHSAAGVHGAGTPDDPFVVDLICQSNGAHLCRYLLKYGDASLDEAESGAARPPAGLHVRKVVLVGTSNGGSLRILREVHRGRRYVPVVGRMMQPETLFTMPAILQDLPGYRPQPFIDERGRRLDVDLFDADTWRVHGFSVFHDAARQRMARRPDLFGSEEQRFAYLQRNLDRGRRLHALLARDVPEEVADFDTVYYLLQNGYDPSPELAVLRPAGSDGDPLLFTGDDGLKDDPYLHYLVSSPGDGHATYDSQRALSRQEIDAIAAPPFLVRGGHFELILDPATLRRMVDFLRMPLPER